MGPSREHCSVPPLSLRGPGEAAGGCPGHRGKPASCQSPGAAVTKPRKLGGWKQQKRILTQFWGPDSETQAGPCALHWLLEVLGVPWVVETSLALFLSLQGLLCVSSCSLLKIPIMLDLGATLIQYDLILIMSVKIVFPKKTYQ